MTKKARQKKAGKYARRTSSKILRHREDPGGAVQIAGLAEAQRSVAGAKRLHSQAGELHQKADQLHHSIEQMHEKVHSLRGGLPHSGEGQPSLERGESRQKHGDGEEQARTVKPFHIVGIGASAGGYEAFIDFLKRLPNDIGMAFVLVQHLDPKHKSQLSDLLGRATHVPVLEAKDGMEVEPNHIYVIPANSSITLREGRLRLGPRAEDKLPPMPIDVFFRSLAREQQHRSIAIVLSGTGSDGTLGIEAIKGEGGITFAQHESSAKFFGMPRSAIGSGTVDFVLPPEGIATELERISKHPYVERAKKGRAAAVAGEMAEKILEKSQKEIIRLFALLRARKGVDFSLYKHSTLKRRIVRRLILHKFDSLARYLAFVEKQPAEVDQLFNDLLIYVTSFFRDARAFEALKKSIFRRIIKAHPGDSPLRFWVCGCSTGEEAYSLAMSLAEFFDQSRTHRTAQIFASDISEQGIARARTGIYPQNIVQDVSPERLRRFFIETDGHYEVQKPIRDMCVFARQNVIVDPPFSNLDLILCRNVLIYLGPMLQRKIFPVFHYALRPGGFLMLGNAETVGGATDLFTQVNKSQKIYLRKAAYFRTALEFPHRGKEAAETEPAISSPPSAQEIKAPDLQEYVDEILLREFSPAAVVVNSAMEVLQFRGRTGDYLEHSAGAASLNLWRMAHQQLALDLRSAVGRAVKEDISVKQIVRYRENGQEREVTIQVLPFRAGSGIDRLFLILFQPTATVPSPAAKPGAKGKDSREKQEVQRLKQELMTTRESLQSVVEEQEEKNEELKAANEEIQSSNEELQSTNEELETAKEELQSTNEELMTLNEELQTRNVELSQALNDLTNFLASVNVAMLMLDDALTLRRFTPVAEKLFNLIPSDLGRPLSDLSRSVFVADLDKSIASVISTLMPMERDVQGPDGHWYSVRIRPYRTRENKIEGVVVVLIDIDSIKRALELLLSTAKEPLVTLGEDLTVRKANASFYHTFHLKPEETEGKFIYDAGDGQWNMLELRKLLEEVLPKNKQVHDFHLEANFRDIGARKLLLNARHFYDEGWGVKMILLAIEDVTRK